MSQTDTKDELKPGAVIDNRYQVVSLLGSGGFANVYKARHVHLNRDVALKVLHPPLTNLASKDAIFSKRFEQEAQIAAGLDHPNIVGIFDYGFLPSDEPYIAMAYLEGHDLEEELMSNGPMNPERAVELMRGCLEGVAHGHDRGVVHKDLKPSNLYLVNPGKRDERLVVLDFGIARVFTDPDAKITQSGLFSGTPAYLAPEYIREQTVSPAVDVYQLGLILIEMLTGQPAVEADGPMGYLLAHCMGRIAVDPAFFETDLGKVCRNAIAISPDDRFPDSGTFADALKDVAVPASVKTTAERKLPTAISQDEVEAFAQTLPESVLADTREWSSRTAEPHMTPRDPSFEARAPNSTIEAPAEEPTRKPAPKTVSVEPEKHSQPPLVPIVVVALVLLAAAIGVLAMVALAEEDTPPTDISPSVSETATEESGESMVFVLDDETSTARATAVSVASTTFWVGVRDGVRAQTREAKRLERPKPKPRPRPRPRPKPQPKPEPKPEPTKPDPKPHKPDGPTIMIGN